MNGDGLWLAMYK
jgi:hypothetical protein